MTNFFDRVKTDVKNFENELFGPDYSYHKFIKSPEEMGMSDRGSISTITNNVKGLIGYVNLLAVGGGDASKIEGPLGDRFFLPTGAKCIDTATGNEVTRSLYFDNIPDGTMPFITSALDGIKFTTFEGLVPGIMSNIAKIHPMQMFQAFMTGTNPKCSAVTLTTRNEKNESKNETAFITLDDQKFLPKKSDGFTTINNIKNNNNTKFPKDTWVQIYYSGLALFGLYIFMLLLKKNKK